jgi:hypothetical protein
MAEGKDMAILEPGPTVADQVEADKAVISRGQDPGARARCVPAKPRLFEDFWSRFNVWLGGFIYR